MDMVKKTSEQHNRLTAQNFASRYGKDESKLEAWQMLCRDVRVPEGGSITQCKKELKGVFVNIVDFVQAVSTGRAVRRYSSAKALRDSIHETGKVFRLRVAKENKLLRELLIQVF